MKDWQFILLLGAVLFGNWLLAHIGDCVDAILKELRKK